MGEKQIHLANGDLLIKTDEGVYFAQPEGVSVPILIDPKEGENLVFETAMQLRDIVENLVQEEVNIKFPLGKVKVSREIAQVLDKQSKDEWSKQFNLISHCKGYSGNGILCGNIYTEEFKALETLQPLEYARCLIVGYEITEE